MALIPQTISGSTYMLMVTIESSFFISMCTYITLLISDLSTYIANLDAIIARDKNHKNSNEIEVHAELQPVLHDMIRFHSNILQISEKFRIIMSGPLFFQLFIYVLFIATNLLQLDEVWKQNIIVTIEYNFVVFSLISIDI